MIDVETARQRAASMYGMYVGPWHSSYIDGTFSRQNLGLVLWMTVQGLGDCVIRGSTWR